MSEGTGSSQEFFAYCYIRFDELQAANEGNYAMISAGDLIGHNIIIGQFECILQFKITDLFLEEETIVPQNQVIT